MQLKLGQKFFLPQVSPEKRELLARLLDPDTSPPDRFKIGFRLAQLGDPRPGLALDAQGRPAPEWIEIPGGDFIYQSGERYCALPTYYISRYPVTVAQFAAFVGGDGYTNPSYWTDEGWAWKQTAKLEAPALWKSPKWHIANHPVVGVTWYEAQAFAVWLAGQLGLAPDMIRLPSEEEWEKAARGVDGRLFAMGRPLKAGDANINESYVYYHVGEAFLKRTTAVGVFIHDTSPYGLMDMTGNVREWTSTNYHHIGHVLRGGGWFSNRHQAQTIFRNWFYDRNGDHSIGFRLAAAILPENQTLRFSAC
jgi:formylglycine-generating enzyme required for sulfatase activity